MTSSMMFQPPLVLDSNNGNALKNFPITLRIYSATSDKQDLYRLRYRAFRHAGWIEESPSEEFIDRYDGLASTFAVGAFHGGACAGTLRLALGGAGEAPHSMPCEEQFSSEILKLSALRPQRLIEFSRMAVEPLTINTSFKTTLYASLVRAGFLLTYAADVQIALIAVHKKTSPFYQAMCGFKVLGESASYAGIAEPTHFLGREVRALDERRQGRNAFFSFSQEEVDRARQIFASAKCQAAA